jgi:hypothetical protein
MTTTLKVWGVALAAVLLALLGWHVYSTYLAVMPPRVWRVVGATWFAWATWHTYRSMFR